MDIAQLFRKAILPFLSEEGHRFGSTLRRGWQTMNCVQVVNNAGINHWWPKPDRVLCFSPPTESFSVHKLNRFLFLTSNIEPSGDKGPSGKASLGQ